ncbi:hypothetical protein OMR58_24985 [Erwinia sp. INIA-01]|uniref:hypothetical protein n=1 Tax=Erwinia sp. INIA01 TaxID=2991500 RepID=UPI0022244D29|nr:hypothetical protein [Erwinia sp. INIA01]MCW1877699.1 hypothetical protein [Erwinia sp. INIA01]
MRKNKQSLLAEKVVAKTDNSNKPEKKRKEKVVLSSLRGKKVSGYLKCDRCKVIHLENWIYSYTDGTTKRLCRFCKGFDLDKAKGIKRDLLNYCVDGSAFGGKRR